MMRNWWWATVVVTIVATATVEAQSTTDANSAHPIGNIAQWFSADSYPPEARVAGEEGTVGFEVAVDAGGKPTACRVTESSGSAALDAKTCELLMAHAEFEPAHDGAGHPVAGAWSNRTTWQLSGPAGLDLSNGQLTMSTSIRVTVDEHGIVTGCKVVKTQGTESSACAAYPIGRRRTPPLSIGEKPVGGVMTMTMSSTIEPVSPE